MTDQDLCAQVTDAMTEVLEGSASDALYDHIASCYRCRDARHDAAQLTEMLADASLDYVHPEDFEARVTTALDAGAAALDGPAESEAELARGGEHLTGGARAAITERVATTRREARGPRGPLFGGWLRKPRNTLIAGAAAAALAGGIRRNPEGPPHPTDEAPVADLPWGGKVARVARAAGGEGGLQICVASQCRPAQAGETIPAGATLETDDRTRAHVTLGDGTELALDRQTELRFESDRNRTATLSHGAIVAEVSKVEGKPAWLRFPLGAVEVLGTKLALRASDSGASVDVSRGKVRLRDVQERSVEVRAGEEGRLYPDAPPYAMAAPSLGDALSWSEDAGDERDLRGLGELKAKKPGEQDERKGAVELASHRVKVRIVDGFARTEVEEVFTNQTNEVLEGIYRFPMPPDAQIERLALQVDDHFEEGAFVDRDRAAAIWRGAIVNASRRAPLPRDEIVWVPGPWRDPALLEWQRGGRFELRIFPIPAKGSRKVVLTYTQVVSPTGDRRRYTYPLAHDPSGNLTVDAFDVDIEVRGHDASRGVQAAGYALSQGSRGDATTLTMASTQFVPTGDLVVEYATAQSGDLSAFAYAPSVDGATASDADDVQKKAEALAKAPQGAATARDRAIEAVEDGRGYVAFTVRPELPQRADDAQRAYVFVVDSSRSMYGERHKRAADVTARVIDELDRLDQFAVLSCDTTCRPMPGGLRAPSRAAAAEAQAFIEGIDPEGGSDPAAAIRDAGAFASQADGRSLRVVYVGDGTPTVGPIRPAYLRRAVEDVLPPGRGTLTAVAIGADADLDSLAAMARGGGGSVLPYVPGQRVGEAAYAVLGATYGSGLRDVSVTLPEGLVEMAPERVDTIVAGGEAVLAARMTRPHVEGDLVLRGKVGNEPFEARYPITVTATSDAGNAFVPRLYAAARIAELERETGAEARAEAVALSSAFNVASRHTSLLVLESPAMFRAFGLDNQRRVAEWTGDVTAVGSTAEDALAEDKKTAGHGDADDYDGEAEAQLGSGFGGPAPSGTSALADRFDDEAPIGGTGASMPRAKVASRPLAQTETPPPAPPRDFAKNKDEDAGGWRERRRGGLVPMRRVF
ncbi:MAG: FecR domain-containing protein, partial [Myxococcales bacterium]|nr:FecR domain-containing protein [Myxococcales bacterium]